MRDLFFLALAALTLTPTPPPAGLLAQEPTYAGVRVLYGPEDGLSSIDAKLIGEARQSIDMAAYVLTDRSLTAALGRAAMRGVKVRLYVDGEERGRGASPIEEIAGAPNLEIRRKSRARDLMHLKSYQVDGRVLRSGSANFTVSGAVYQDNDVIVIESPQAAARFREAFERLWARPDNQRIGLR
ncbi:phospholipase D-like domain-containing protein [Methylocystis sp. 9N]|uniref:phospholipase D n=1 Tax=Methylocystis borbori TaxID=3118750 RepID=A0ABU7XHZ9_9HYPH